MFETVKLGEILTVLTDYHANGSYKILKENVTLLDKPDYAVMIRTTNFEKNDFSDDFKYINKHAYDFLAKSKVYPGDILMNKIANAGSVYYMPDLKRPVSLAMNLFLIRVDRQKVNQRYVYYYLKTNEAYVKGFAIGAATNTITKANVKNLEITFPQISVQEKIVAILSAYDNLIENNTRRIKILEEMAQNLYREWFVDYRFPGHEKVKMVDSPLGKIPEGWEVANLSEVTDFIRGIEPGSKNYLNRPDEGTVPFLRVGDLGSRDSSIFIPFKLAQGKLLNKTDIVITLDGTVGIVRIGLFGAYSTGIRKVIIRDCKRLNWAYLYFLLGSDHIQGIITAHAKGTTILHAGSSVEHMTFALPPARLVCAFETQASTLLKSILNLSDKNQNLRQTRDLLLPKLISGQVDVSELNIETGAK